jgi:hypothetical protein
MRGDGNTLFRSSTQSPIYYDRDDTNYYANPAGTSVFNGLTVGGYNVLTGGNLEDYTSNIENGSFYNITDSMTSAEVRKQLGNTSSKIEKIDDNTAPAEGAFKVTGYLGFDDARYIKIDKESQYTFEVWIKVVDGGDTNQRLYMGWTMYDRNKSSYGNSKRYWGSGGTQFDTNTNTNGWYKVTGKIKGDGFHADAQYARPVLLFNYSSNVGVTHYCGLKLYKSEQSLGRLRLHGSYGNNAAYVHNLTDQRYPYIEGGDSNTLRIQSNSGYVDFGAMNTSHLHMYTDRGSFYTNKMMYILGGTELRQGDVRASIFYDKDTTSRYLNPNGTSRVNEIEITDTIRMTNYGIGITGTYTSTRLQTIFNMDDQYSIAQDGNATNNAYGLYWSHPNAGSLGGANNLNDHGLLIINNGSFRAAISSRAVFSSDVRGTQFYDYNNTGYYVNPAGQSHMNTLTLAGNRIGFINPAFDAEIRVSDSNPDGTGAEFTFYGDTGARNAQLSAEVGSFNARVRTPIMYDYNDSGYYVDPNSLTNLNNLTVQGTLNLNGTVDLGDDYEIDVHKTIAINSTLNASGTQARRFEIARIAMDYNDWNGTGTFEVELHEQYYGRGSKKTYQVFWGYNNAYQVRLVDANIYGNNHFRVTIGSPVTISGDIRYVPVYVDVRYYTQVKARVRTTRSVTYTDNTPARSWAYINKSPGASNIGDFSADNIIYKTESNIAADIFYDANNTGYYGNFASTSYMNDVRANIFYERENTAYYFGSSQGDARMRNVRFNEVRIENGVTIQSVNGNGRIYLGGNFHIDAQNGNDLYLNYYSGRRTRTYYSSNREAWRSDTDGIVYAFNQHRSPIYYDYNNTGYYSDPSGASNFNTSIRATEIYARNWFRNDNSGEGLYNQATGMHWYSDSSSRWRLYSGSSSTAQILFTTSGNSARGYVYATNSNEIGFLDAGGSWAMRHQNDNGTYFYTDNSTLEFRVGRDTVTGNYGTVQTSSTRGGWGGYSINGGWVFMHDHSNAAGIFNDYENEWAIYMLRNSYVELMYNGTWELATRSGYGLARGSMRAPLFYDSNDTGYYIDPNSTSNTALRMRGGALFGPNQSWGEYLAVGGNGRWTSSYASVASTNGNLHLDARSGRSMYLNWYTGGTVYVNGAMQANIYYDRDSTSYYGNFASTSYMNDVRANIFYDRNNTAYYFGSGSGDSRFNRVTGNYFINDGSVSSDDRFGIFWSSDRSEAYAIFRESGGWSYRYPDLRIAFHTGIKFGANSSYNGMRFYNDYNMATQVMSVNNATDPLGGNNVYVNYNLQAGDSLRAPIIYDSNNTGYYFNGASAHSTRFEGVSNRTMAYMGLPGHTRNSGEYYRSRPRQTGDTNYWTGAYGWGRQDMNVVSTWGSGFIDSWSNPGNQPSGTSHWVGMQAFHYRSSNTGGYGWQMVGGPITNLRFRSSWSGWRSWRTIPVLDENSSNGGSMYAGRYYDSNNTGYYCDPAGTSQLSYVLANDWFRAQGGTGLYFQDRGYGLRSVGDEGGQYGTVSTYGSINGWEGWSMNGRSLLMHNNSSSTGLYNDVNNEWLCEGIHNSHFYIHYNGGWKARTESWGLRINDNLYAEGNVIAYYSDMRLKDKEGDIENALEKVGKLNGFYYRNNKEANMIGWQGNDLQVGVSAQDVKSVLPEIVHPAPKAQRLGYDYMTVDYDRLTPLLVNAINEQNDIVKSQKEEIEYLKSELSELKEMMKELLNKK